MNNPLKPLADKYTQQVILEGAKQDTEFEKQLKKGIEEANFAQDVGEILGRGVRGSFQRAKDVQDAGGKLTAKIMGTHYPRKADYPTSHPRDFERAAQAHQKDLLSKSLDIDKISNDITANVLSKARVTLGGIDLDNLDKSTADFLTNVVDNEIKMLKKSGMDSDNVRRVQREVIQKLGLDLYR